MSEESGKKRKPLGIILSAIACFLWIPPTLLSALFIGITDLRGGILGQLIRGFFLFLPVGLLISGIGLLMLRNSARILVLCLSWGALLYAGFGFYDVLVSGAETGLFGAVLLFLVVLVFGSLIYYLTRPKVKEQFQQPQRTG